MTKRKGHKFKEANIHTALVIIIDDSFVVYEQYGTWFFKEY